MHSPSDLSHILKASESPWEASSFSGASRHDLITLRVKDLPERRDSYFRDVVMFLKTLG